MSEHAIEIREPGRQPEGLLCPACKVDLVMADRQGIEIDYCPKCRGLWLDRGELDKIIERSMDQAPATRPQDTYRGGGHGGGHGGGYGGGHGQGGYRRRKSWFGELFD